MIEIAGQEGTRDVAVGAQRGAVPATLPVLPLRETIPLPDTLTPLAIGQERSVQLVDDALRGDRRLVNPAGGFVSRMARWRGAHDILNTPAPKIGGQAR